MVKDLLAGMLIMAIIVSVFAGALHWTQTSHNEASADVWNNGICKACDQRFIPYCVNNGAKYYVCYGCGTEITRH